MDGKNGGCGNKNCKQNRDGSVECVCARLGKKNVKNIAKSEYKANK